MPNCANCDFVITTEVKDFEGETLDTRCHRQVISDLFDAMTEEMPKKVRYYFGLSGGERLEYRDHLRYFISDYRSLSY